MTSRLWTPTPEDQLYSIDYLLGLAPDNDEGLIEAVDLRTIIQHFASMDAHHAVDIAAAVQDAADAHGTAGQAQSAASAAQSSATAASGVANQAKSDAAAANTNANNRLAKASIAAGSATIHGPTTGGLAGSEEGWHLSEDHPINFGKTFSKVPLVIASPARTGADKGNRRWVIAAFNKTTTGCHLLANWVDETVNPPKSSSASWNVYVDWIAVAL